MSDEPSFHDIVSHYERQLGAHGDGARAVDWNSEAAALTRYDVMLDLIVRAPADLAHPTSSLLDFGCGLGALKARLDVRAGAEPALTGVSYEGLDISEAFVAKARAAWPGVAFHQLDLLASDAALPAFDYIVMNGVFTRRETLSPDAMLVYLEKLTTAAFARTRRGLAFNVMSALVDYHGGELFHPSLDALTARIGDALSRRIVLRNDYKLYETTVYVYRDAPEVL